jgi:hypothetical protein
MWLASNTYLFAYNMAKREYSEAAIFFANMITTFIGVKNTYKDPYWFKPRK